MNEQEMMLNQQFEDASYRPEQQPDTQSSTPIHQISTEPEQKEEPVPIERIKT